MRAVLSIAQTTLGEALRRKVLLIILLIGILLVGIAPGLNMLSARSETTTLRGLTLGVIQMTSAAIAIILTVYLIPNEIERRTIYTILSKPVHRWQFLVGKYLGAVLALGMMMGLMTLVMVTVFAIKEGTFASAPALTKAPAMFFVQMSLLASVAMCFSTFVSPLVNIFLSGGVYFVGTFFNTIFESMKDNPSTNPISKLFAMVIHLILPNFSYYNIQNPLVNPGQVIENESLYYFLAPGYGLLYIAIMLVIGILVFEKREV